MVPKRMLSYVCYAQAFLIGLLLEISAFITWIDWWGVGGGFFAFFLFPLALLGFPLVQHFIFNAEGALFIYFNFLIGSILLLFAGWLADKAEYEEAIEKKKVPIVWWLLPVNLTIIGDFIAGIISQIKYHLGWWEFIIGGIVILAIWDMLEEFLPPWLILLLNMAVIAAFVCIMWRKLKRKSELTELSEKNQI